MPTNEPWGQYDRTGMLKFADSQRSVLVFLGVTTLIALSSLLWSGSGWIVDVLTALAAAAAAFMACTRLALDTPNAASRRVWQAAAILVALVCVGQFAGGSLVAVEPLLLVAALILLGLAGWFDPMPMAARLTVWLAFLVQAGATAAPVLSQRTEFAANFLALISVELYWLGAAVFVAWVRRDMFIVHRRASDVGDLARYLFATSRLFKKVRHPRIGNFTVPGHKLVFVLLRFLRWFPTIGPQVRAKAGVGLWRQFRDLCVVAMRHGLDAQVYYMFELYRPERRARTSGYLTRYELKNGLYKVLTWQVSKSKRRIMLGDKLGMNRICEEHGIPTVPILVVGEGDTLEYRCDRPAGLQRDLFIKPRQSKGSRGTEVIRYAGGQYTCEDGAKLDYDGLIALIERRAKEMPILVQPLIANHPRLADMAQEALMRMRVVTCQDEAGNPVVTHAVLSNLCKLETKWPTDIELGAAVDLETGALGMVTGDKAGMWLDWSEDHPITRARVLGRIVPCWDQMRSIALAAHAACRDRLLVGWDIAVGPDGAVLLEGNSYPDVDFLQRAHQCAIGDSPLGPLLYARLTDLERRVATGTLRGPLDYE
jgi:hypothetical protein